MLSTICASIPSYRPQPILCFPGDVQTTAFYDSTPTEWELVVNKDAINIYTRANPDSGIKEVRVTTQIKIGLTELMTFLGDVPNYPNWVFKCSKANRLATNSEQDYYYYTQTEIPFPLKDRDLVVHSRQWQDAGGVVHSRSQAAPDYIPRNDNLVRIQYFESNWKITPGQDGMVFIDYTVKTDPGGGIPAWVVNLAITKGPLKTMQQLMASLPQKQYEEVKPLSYISN